MSNIKNHWSGYINAIGKMNPTSSTTIPFETSSSKIGVSGFLDLKPKEDNVQQKYDAMAGSWEGVDASEKATLKSKSDRTEFMSWSK